MKTCIPQTPCRDSKVEQIEQIEAEVGANIDLVLFVLSSLGLNDYRVRIGLRDPSSDKYVGSAEDWEKAENTLIELVREAQVEKIPYMRVVGEKEQTAKAVAVRDRVDGDIGAIPLDALIQRLTDELRERWIRSVSTASAGLGDRGAKFES